ncbi:Mu transposase C-terminal domain-containing protein [Microvirga sp. 17 mud 1-3]|uniref:Mu transposase C-terminal domain-containing protein n=1 Tax=Microvirga sp. 17 mud 1-3 TaxID=2082949 RepID=UPI0013A58C8F|nr:Mu transposase C-terminal domain-containing protein [Microvirga sp. 17 mud 1-3]
MTRTWAEGSEWWIVKNTKDNVKEERSRAELDRLYDEGALRFDGDKDEDRPERRKDRQRKASVPLSDLDLKKQTRIKFRRAVIRAVDEGTTPGTKTAKIIEHGTRTDVTVLQSLLDELGRTLGQEYLGREETIHASTYYRWCVKYGEYGDYKDLAGDFENRGNRNQLNPIVRSILREEMAAEIEAAHHRNFPGGKARPVMKHIMAGVLKRLKAERLRNPGIELPMPQKSTFYNHWNQYPAYQRDLAKYGPTRVKQLHRHPRPIDKPQHCLAVVQFDETRLPIFVIDEILGVPLGRPWLAWLIDVFSGAIIGFYLGFEPPSDLVLGSTLRHAVSRKSYVAQHYPGLPPFPYGGIPHFIVFDNSLPAHSRTALTNTFNLDVPFDFTPPRTPWAKAEVEGAFNVANSQWLQGMSGFVLDLRDGIDRVDYDPAKNAVMGFRQLFYLLHCWLLEVYHHSPTPGTRLTPDQRWTAGTAEVDPEYPETSTDMDVMFGIVREGRRLDHRGVVYENIRYYSDGLHLLRNLRGHELKVKVKVNPLDLGKIHVWEPKEEFWIPATARETGYGGYAEGLELHCHKLYLRHAERLSGRNSLEALIESRLHLQEMIAHALPDALSIRASGLIARALGVGSQHVFANLDPNGNLPTLTGPFAGQPLNPYAALPTPNTAGGTISEAFVSEAQDSASPLPVAPQRQRVIPAFRTDRSLARSSE